MKLNMRKWWLCFFMCLVSEAFAATDTTDSSFIERTVTLEGANLQVEKANLVLQNILQVADKGIPSELLNSSEAIAIIPDMMRIAIGIGGSLGRGILVVRSASQQWSSPALVSLSSGNFGLQLGVNTTSVLLLFKKRSEVEKMGSTKLLVNAVAGPLKTAKGGQKFEAEVYAYAFHKGTVVGLALKESALEADYAGNKGLYSKEVNVSDIFASKITTSAKAVAQLQELLQKNTP